MLDTPQITETDAQQTAVIHLTVPRTEIRNVMGPGLKELMSTVAAQGITAAGPGPLGSLRGRSRLES